MALKDVERYSHEVATGVRLLAGEHFPHDYAKGEYVSLLRVCLSLDHLGHKCSMGCGSEHEPDEKRCLGNTSPAGSAAACHGGILLDACESKVCHLHVHVLIHIAEVAILNKLSHNAQVGTLYTGSDE